MNRVEGVTNCHLKSRLYAAQMLYEILKMSFVIGKGEQSECWTLTQSCMGGGR